MLTCLLRQGNCLQFYTFLACLLVLAPIGSVAEDEPPGDPVNWYYSAAFGTGVYQSGDTRVAVVRIPFKFSLSDQPEDAWNTRLLVPVSLGYYDYDFDNIVDLELPTDLSTISVLPGVEFEKYVAPRWRLKPFVQLGGGIEMDGDTSALIYSAGIRSLYRFKKAPRLVLGNTLIYAGFDSSENEREATSLLITGLGYTQPISWRSFDRGNHIDFDINYYYYFNDLDFTPVIDNPFSLRQEIELAVALGWDKPVSLLGFPFERIGLAYRYGDDITGWKLVAGRPF